MKMCMRADICTFNVFSSESDQSLKVHSFQLPSSLAQHRLESAHVFSVAVRSWGPLMAVGRDGKTPHVSQDA